jgi:glycosyltransferase involved in cell wall biosynthesis
MVTSLGSELSAADVSFKPPEQPRVTIGVPVRNGERFLAATLDSLLLQTFSDFELIISDNASSDSTGQIAAAYAAMDDRIKYHRHQENVGISGNYNYLVSVAKGGYFKWAAGDDLCEPTLLERCVDTLEQNSDVVLAYAKTRFIDDAGGPLEYIDPGFNLQSGSAKERLRYVIFAGHWVNAIFGLIRTAALRQTSLLPRYAGGDYPLLGELAVRGKFVEVPEALFLRRIHSAASSQNTQDLALLTQMWTGKVEPSFPNWSRSHDHFKTITGSDMGAGEKFSLLFSLGRSMFFNRLQLLSEVCKYFSAS